MVLARATGRGQLVLANPDGSGEIIIIGIVAEEFAVEWVSYPAVRNLLVDMLFQQAAFALNVPLFASGDRST